MEDIFLWYYVFYSLWNYNFGIIIDKETLKKQRVNSLLFSLM